MTEKVLLMKQGRLGGMMEMILVRSSLRFKTHQIEEC